MGQTFVPHPMEAPAVLEMLFEKVDDADDGLLSILQSPLENMALVSKTPPCVTKGLTCRFWLISYEYVKKYFTK